MPLEGCDVLLGMPWFYNHKAVLDSFIKTVTSEIIFLHETESSNSSPLDVSRRAFLDEYADCFSEALPGQLPPERLEDHNIDLIPDSAAPHKPPYKVSAAQQEEIMTQMNELLQKVHIQLSCSPFCSPVLLVQKKDGSWRMCIDYRALNKITVKNKFPIPRIDDVLQRLQGASFFSKLDLKSGYHQIRVNPADVPKTAFRTTFGLYEILVMPFGLTNAPATFNRMMDRIFRPLRHCVGTFFDDTIVLSKSEAKHMEHLRALFEMLRKERMVVNGKKSEIHFLGHIVSKDGVRMDPAKIKAIQDSPKPVHEVRSFLGLCSYYHRFIHFFAEIAAPLHGLTRKGVVFRFGERQQQAFKLLKEKLTTEQVLILPDLRKYFQVQCDACGSSFGAVLMQELLKEKLTTEPVLILPDLRKYFQVQCDACGSSFGAVLMQDGHVIA
ncbi:hypothetical protein L7F22_064472 [Adiantum nelumboides]|nr:hypothetical protein [Adiantum nelumboides]